MKSVMRGAMLDRSPFSNHVGIGSRAHALVEDFMTICETSLIMTGMKTHSSELQGGRETTGASTTGRAVPDFLNLILEEVCKLIG